jgi:hypothetical protein
MICPKPLQEVLDNQKKIKNEKVRAKAHPKKKKPAKKEKESTADEMREDGEEESKNVEQQVVTAAAAGPHASLLVPAVAATVAPQASSLAPPVMTWIPHQFNPNPYFYGGFNPFNSFNNDI